MLPDTRTRKNIQETMKRISALVLIAGALLLSPALLPADGKDGDSGKNGRKMETGTVHLTKTEFLEKVYNYEASPQVWKYEGTKPTLLFIPLGGDPSMSPGAPSKAQLKEVIEGHLLK